MPQRILGLLIRYKNISFGSIPRLISVFYWPSVQILFWGFFTNFLIDNSSLGVWNAGIRIENISITWINLPIIEINRLLSLFLT